MSSIDRTAPLLAALAALALAGGALVPSSAASAATIVVRANGPSAASFPPGTKLPDNGTIVLRPGDTVTVLDAHGTRVLRARASAGAVPVAGTGAATVNGIAALIADNGQRQVRTGATRGSAAPPHPTNVWQIDATRSGPFCVVDAKTLALWRPASDTPAMLRLTRATDGKAATVPFRAGQAVSPWPADTIAIEDGTTVRIAGLANPPSATVVLKLLPAVPVTLDETASVLLAQGCSAQVDLLVDATTDDAAE
jgi:hypothetical protein